MGVLIKIFKSGATVRPTPKANLNVRAFFISTPSFFPLLVALDRSKC